MTNFLASIIQDSRPREQASVQPGGADGTGAEIPGTNGLGKDTTLNESHDPGSAGNGQIPLSPGTGPGLASPPPSPGKVWSPTIQTEAVRPVVDDPVDDPGVVSQSLDSKTLADFARTRAPGEAKENHLDSADSRPVPHPNAPSPEKVQAFSAGPDGEASGSPKTSSKGVRHKPLDPAQATPSRNLLAASDHRSEQSGNSPWQPSGQESGDAYDHRREPLRNPTTRPPAKPPQPRPMDSRDAEREGDTPVRAGTSTTPAQRPLSVEPMGRQGARLGPQPASHALGASPVDAGPKVHIGRVDVTVTAPATPSPRALRAATTNPINRQYLRRV